MLTNASYFSLHNRRIFRSGGNDGRGTVHAGSKPRHAVRIARHGADGAFGWKILREADAIVFASSTCLFGTRLEAILDSARAAAALEFAHDEPSSIEREGCSGN
jgi:hypothetical protein